MSDGEDLIKRPVESLLNYTNLEANVITIVYGSAFERIKLFETVATINGQDIWYGSWNYDANFTNTGGVTFQIPLADFHRRLTTK